MPALLAPEIGRTGEYQQSGEITRHHELPSGAELQPDGCVRFSIWAPGAPAMQLEIEGLPHPFPMERYPNGHHELVTDQARAGSRYRFVLPDGTRVPDPASRFQPEDVKGPSEVIDPTTYKWTDDEWRGRPWSEAVIYELHVGAFTEQGTFRSSIEKLDHLRDLGVTAIEIMPIGDFAGRRNWGYDGVLLYAPDSSYGRPEDLKALVEAAHQRGIMVLLDVVYNHFGPDGNYLPVYAPQILTDCHSTAWGDAINYDNAGSESVREFVIHNALYWIEEFHLDGLRLDAVHAIKDDSPKHLLRELAERVRAAVTDRPIHLVLENEDNQAFRLRRDENGQPLRYTAQWNDDMHHVLHCAATLEENGYYKDYKDDTEKLARALAEGFAFQGHVMECIGKERGEPSAHLPPAAFVAFMQNHDQIGNRAFGERISAIAAPEAVHAIAAIYLLLPQIPMLFMGEEWGSNQPFLFFCDFEGELGQKVVEGRRKEFASFPEFKDPEKRETIPNPLAEETFLACKLDWAQASNGVHAEWLDWYKHILSVRREVITPLVARIGGHAGHYEIISDGSVIVTWAINDGSQLLLAVNLSSQSVQFPPLQGEAFWEEGTPAEDGMMRPCSIRWSLRRNA